MQALNHTRTKLSTSTYESDASVPGSWRMVLLATCTMRDDANYRFVAASESQDLTALVAAAKLHHDAEQIAKRYQLK